MYNFNGFSINLYQDSNGTWLAHFVELPNVSGFSNSPEKALKELHTAWELVKESYIEDGENIPVAPSRKLNSSSKKSKNKSHAPAAY